MLNWWLIAIFAALALAGFTYLDEIVLEFVEGLRRKFHPCIDKFFRIISFTPLVVLMLYVIPIIFVFCYLDLFSAAAFTLACFLATGLAFILKYTVKRVRPMGNTTYLGKVDSAFPSAHTAGSFVAAFTLGVFWPAWGILFFVIAFLVATSRMYLELHYFSDVMGGILLAYVAAIFTLDSGLMMFLESLLGF